MLAAPDVEAAVNQHVERKPRSGAKFQDANASFLTIAERDEADACDLLEPSDTLQ